VDFVLKIQGVTKITNRKYLNLFSINYTDRHNQDKSCQIASRKDIPKCVSGEFDLPDAVVIVPYHQKKQKLVLISEFRVALGGFQYGFPAGLLDRNESVEDAGARELKEETGLRVTRVLNVGPPVYSSSGMTDESVAMLYVECDGEASKAGNESSEEINTLFVSPAEAALLLKHPEHPFDVKTWLVVSFFAAHGSVVLK